VPRATHTDAIYQHHSTSPQVGQSQRARLSYFKRAALSLHDTALPCGEIGAQVNQVNIDAATVAAYARHYAAVNPWLARSAERPLGVIVTAQHAVPHADLLKTEYYHDLRRPQDIDLAVGLAVLEDGSSVK